MTPATLYALHERLTSDTARAFDTRGHGAAICVTPTEAGRAWLNDWHEYRLAWKRLHDAEQHPDALLKARFGYVMPDELEPEPDESHDNGRGASPDEDGPPIIWYTDTIREEYDPDDAA